MSDTLVRPEYTNLSPSRTSDGIPEDAAAIPAVNPTADGRSDSVRKIAEPPPTASPARTSRRGFLMNTMVSTASLATAVAVAAPPIATTAPTTDAVSFPDLVARFLPLRERWKSSAISDSEWDETGTRLTPVVIAIVNQPPKSLSDLGWQAEAFLTWADDFETIEEHDDEADRMVKTLLANVRSLATPLPMVPNIVPAAETADPIFAAIARHRTAAAIWDVAVDERANFPEHGNQKTEEERQQIWDLDEAEDEAHEPLVQAGLDLINTRPTTAPGIIAMIEYMRAQMLDDGTYMPHHLEWDGDGDARETKAWIDAFLATLVTTIAGRARQEGDT